ncbi:MAG: FMN-binding protein, partial [Bacteroidota bacterium]
WDDIWGNIALKDDLSTIVGAAFDHKGETPGLGAEIKDNPAFPAKFKQKQIYDASGNYTSVDVVKPGIKTTSHSVDGISGATVTCVGVAEMLDRGIAYYEPYLKTLKQ